jgi:hypothetical protein
MKRGRRCADFCAAALSDRSTAAEKSGAKFSHMLKVLSDWGTWIRTKTGGVRVRAQRLVHKHFSPNPWRKGL